MPQVDKNASQVPGYHPVTRWLHAGLVLGVLFQLLCAVWMAHPEHAGGGHDEGIAHVAAGGGDTASVPHAHDQASMRHGEQAGAHTQDAFGQWFMSAHRNGGVWVVLITMANLIWAVVKRGPARKRQIAVLYSATHWHQAWLLLQQLPRSVAGKQPLPEPGNALSLVIEMLGLLSMTAMALSGFIVWNLWSGPGGMVSEGAELWMSVHGALAVLLFTYLLGHVSMALLHWYSGDPVFKRILPVAFRCVSENK